MHIYTDGAISSGEEQGVLDLLGTKQSLSSGKLASMFGGKAPGSCPAASVFCLGIGDGVHRGLLNGMAARTGGVAQYVVDGESITAKCTFLKKCALSSGVVLRPRIKAKGAMVKVAPHVLPPRLFPGEPFHVSLV